MKRGGSWDNNAQNARAAYRNNDDPGNRNNNLGCRLASPGVSRVRPAGRPAPPSQGQTGAITVAPAVPRP